MTETGEESMGRQGVRALVRKTRMEAPRSQEDFKKALSRTKDIVGTSSENELEATLDPEHYLGVTGKAVYKILSIVRGAGSQ